LHIFSLCLAIVTSRVVEVCNGFITCNNNYYTSWIIRFCPCAIFVFYGIYNIMNSYFPLVRRLRYWYQFRKAKAQKTLLISRYYNDKYTPVSTRNVIDGPVGRVAVVDRRFVYIIRIDGESVYPHKRKI